MTSVQLNFTLRVGSKSCKTVHLLGSWDNYQTHLPLARESGSSKPIFFGNFRFPRSALRPGSRYWYYYMVDAHSVTYDPKHQYVIEPTTGRTLNVLDIPPNGPDVLTRDARPPGRHHPRSVANGRSLSPSQIQHPLPSRPYETKAFSSREMEALSRRYAAQRISESGSSDGSSSDEDSYGYRSGNSSDIPSLSSRSSRNSSPSSLSSGSGGGGAPCTCERYAITRAGHRLKLDCGGKVCAGSDDGSACSSESEEEKRRDRRRHAGGRKQPPGAARDRRRGLYVR